jgi:hypothetical protein
MLYKSHLDKNKLFDTWLPFVLNLDKRKENWNKAIASELSLNKFLEKEIYANK